MTDELTKTFFDTFGIEPTLKYYCPSCNTELEKCLDSEGIYYRCGNHLECDYFLDVQSEDFEECLNCLSFKLTYPQITDRILLELICLCPDLDDVFFTDVEQLKETLLTSYIKIYKYYTEVEQLSDCEKELKHQVRTLFEEG